MNNNEEEKFIELFKPLRAIKPSTLGLSLALVTPTSSSRFFIWRYGVAVSALAMALFVYLGVGRALDPESEVLAMEIASEEIGNEIELLDTHYDYEFIEENEI